MIRTTLGYVFLAALAAAQPVPARAADVTPCVNCAEWNMPQVPFRIYGDSYYVGVRGLSAILITSSEGHILIDGGLAESAPRIAASIAALGFRVTDVRWILNSHAHHDHAGGIAELQRLSGANVAASAWSAGSLTQGGPLRGDPQFRDVSPIATVPQVRVIGDGQVVAVGPLTLTAHLTPGHTPGGTTWTWRSCEGARCLDLVYADSLTAVASDGFLFTASADYPNALADFERSFATLSAMPCDVLVVPHPGFVDLFGKLARRENGEADALVDPRSCANYAAGMRRAFETRVTRERTTGR
jgi:metallo-beta-lactamase class B